MPQTQGTQACKISTLIQLKSHTDFQVLTVEISIPTVTNGQVIQTKATQRNTGANRYYKPNKPNKYLQIIPPKTKEVLSS